MAKPPIPTNSDIQAFLEQLRQYRASLNAPEQRLLDALVAAGMGRARDDQADEVGTYWVTDWPTTPWGTAHRAARRAASNAAPGPRRAGW